MFDEDDDDIILNKKEKRRLNKLKKKQKKQASAPPPEEVTCQLCGNIIYKKDSAIVAETIACKPRARWLHNVEVICGIISEKYTTMLVKPTANHASKLGRSVKKEREIMSSMAVAALELAKQNYDIDKETFYRHLRRHPYMDEQFLKHVRRKAQGHDRTAPELRERFLEMFREILEPPEHGDLGKCPAIKKE